MTTPITAQPTYTYNLDGPPNMYGFRPRILELVRSGYKQTKPYDQPLNFSAYKRHVTGYSAGTSDRGQDLSYYETVSSLPTLEARDPHLYNQAYAKFKERIAETASVGVSLAERKQALQMMENRLFQLARFTNFVRKGRFGEAANELGVKLSQRKLRRLDSRFRKSKRKYYFASELGSPNPRKVASGFAKNYLEFHFGWSPLMADIHNAAEVLSSAVQPRRVSAKAKLYRTGTGGSFPRSYNSSSNAWTTKTVLHTLRQDCTLRAEFQVTNPNLLLASQLGLINPVTIAWELVPFSFVLDWFVNVGDFLSQFTDFAGIQLIYPHMTVFSERTHTERQFHEYNVGNPPRTLTGPYSTVGWYTSYSQFSKRHWSLERVVYGSGFPGPSLKVRNPWVMSPRRGLAAVSLIIQRMPKTEVKAARPVISRRSSVFRGQLAESYWHL